MGQGGREVGGGRRRLGEDKGGYCFFCFGFVTNRRSLVSTKNFLVTSRLKIK